MEAETCSAELARFKTGDGREWIEPLTLGNEASAREVGFVLDKGGA